MENILINKHGHIVITDFGLAKCLMTGEKTSTVTGTLKYMGKTECDLCHPTSMIVYLLRCLCDV